MNSWLPLQLPIQNLVLSMWVLIFALLAQAQTLAADR